MDKRIDANKIVRVKYKFNKSNKYMLYLDYDDIKLLFNYIEYLENIIDSSGNHIPEID